MRAAMQEQAGELKQMLDLASLANAAFTYRDFSNDATFFGFERLDRVWEGHVEFLFRDWDLFGSNPFIRYEYTNQDSNSPLVDYDKHEISVGIRAIVF